MSTDRTATNTEPFAGDPVSTPVIPAPLIGELAWHLRGRTTTVVTGAGMSTDSGIPDYRGPRGSLKKRSPVTITEFLRSEDNRRRYWARACLGWPFMVERKPNEAHRAVAEMQSAGLFLSLITQNVDGLHHAAGSRRVIELHGGLSQVVCLDCAAHHSRNDIQAQMLTANPGWMDHAAEIAPDGDAELPRSITDHFIVPPCPRCGGILKPDVVLFGENVPPPRVAEAFRVVDEGDALLVLGSSLAVYSGFRFADYAVRRGIPLLIVNQGPTRADSIATLKVDARLTSVLQALTDRLIPRSDAVDAMRQ
ncbi:MAG: NAD-dependent protein deacetylase [Alkalispirochaeta sp.]